MLRIKPFSCFLTLPLPLLLLLPWPNKGKKKIVLEIDGLAHRESSHPWTPPQIPMRPPHKGWRRKSQWLTPSWLRLSRILDIVSPVSTLFLVGIELPNWPMLSHNLDLGFDLRVCIAFSWILSPFDLRSCSLRSGELSDLDLVVLHACSRVRSVFSSYFFFLVGFLCFSLGRNRGKGQDSAGAQLHIWLQKKRVEVISEWECIRIKVHVMKLNFLIWYGAVLTKQFLKNMVIV